MSKKATRLHRRRFLKTALSAGGAAVMAPTIIPSSALGLDGAVAPSERIVVGGIGIGNRGTYDLGCFLEQKDVQFVAVCDVKEARRDAVKKMVDEKYGNQNCDTYRDFRELLDRKDIDAVLIATGPNWHATAAMNAAKAGKDMYCEKPCTKNIAQSLILADTMRRTGRVFQAGTQRRNLPHFAFACELARTGKLGKLKTVYAHPAGMTRHDERLAARRARAGRRKSSIGTCTSGPRPGGRSTPSCSTASTSKKGAGWSAAACWNGARIASTCANGPWGIAPVAGRIQPAERRPHGRPLRQRRRVDLPRNRLDSARLVPRAVRRRDRLGRSGRQRQAGVELAGIAGRANGRRNRRLSGDVPRSRFPRLREDAQPAEGQRRRGLQRPYRLPRGEHRPVPRIAR